MSNIDPLAGDHDSIDAADRRDIQAWIRAQDDEIRLKARAKCADLIASIEKARGRAGCGGDGFQRRQPAVDEQF